jgi:hypothetical protein
MSNTKGICSCGNAQESKGRYKDKQIYSRYCSSCKKDKLRLSYLYKTNMRCSKCNFKAEHKSQLDIDHIDGNHKNNDSSNIQVLCANCHRLKTYINKDYLTSF